jgi:fructan beta-fructosidase
MRKLVLLFFLTFSGCVFGAEPQLLFVNSDFEDGSLLNWTAVGAAFAIQPTKGDNTAVRGSGSCNLQGQYWIGTYEAYNDDHGSPGDVQGDFLVGALKSAEFEVDKPYINFLVGGGSSDDTAVLIKVEGAHYFLAAGMNSEAMRQVTADVSVFLSKQAAIVILDDASGGWGHVNADHFTSSDAPVVTAVTPRLLPQDEFALTVDKKYLILPIDNDASESEVSVKLDYDEVRYVTATLATSEPNTDWWGFFDVSEYEGEKLNISVNDSTEAASGLIVLSDTVPGQENWGDEPKRPQFHFSQKVGWNNDANGTVYYDGQWHLYFQHNPVGLPWGNMTWGHAVSEDLVNWRQLPNVLHHKRGDAMFSGGGAIDWQNTGGWKTGANDVLFVTWTSTGRGECIAYSNDKGRTFTEYEGNPIITHSGRDPKPFWYEYDEDDEPLNNDANDLGGHWVIGVFNDYDGTTEGWNTAFHTSTDLKEWTLQSHLFGFVECPELFQLAVDGDPNDKRWVTFAGDAKYVIGDFDGKTFVPEHPGKHQLHWGSYYASQCFSDAPDGRVVQIAWAGIAMGDTCFNQTFSFPTELSLRSTTDGVRMFGEPVNEISKIHGVKHERNNVALSAGSEVEVATAGALFDIRATFDLGTATSLSLIVDDEAMFNFDCVSKTYSGQVLDIANNKVSVQILIDRPMKEMFIDNGEMVFTTAYNNDLNIESVKAVAYGGNATLVSLEVYELNASWEYTCSELQAEGLGYPGDYNSDCYVDWADLIGLAESWLKCNEPGNPDCWK